MYYDRSRRKSSPRRVLILLILVGVGAFLLINQNTLRQQVIPPPTATPTRTARSYVVEAEAVVQTGNLPNAITAYIQAATLDPKNVDVLAMLARLLAMVDRTTEAVKWAERAVQAVPHSAPAQAALALANRFHANALLLQGRDTEARRVLDQALAAAKQAIALDAAYPEGLAYLAEIYAELGDLENAVVYIQKALGLSQTRTEVWRAYGTVLDNQGKFTDAGKAYEEAIKLAPNVAYLYLLLGRAQRNVASLRDPSLWRAALETFKQGAQIDPTDVRLLDEWGWTHYQLDEYRDAQEVLERAVTLNPQAWSPRSHLAATYFARTQYETAIDSFKQALDLMNQTFDADHYCVTAQTFSCARLVAAYTTLGYAYRMLRQCDPYGLGAFRKALAVRPDDATAQGAYNLCAEDLGTPVPRTPIPRS
jgi:tetratricopeptide (TPR) repeat protein